MSKISYKTTTISGKNIQRKWYVVDAEDKVLGRLASQIVMVLQGKNKPSYSPNIDTGDHVIVINAEKVKLTGKKMEEKEYVTYSGYPGGQKIRTPKQVLAKKPEEVIERAVRGMLPKTRMGRAMFGKLHVFAGPDHIHEAQQPETLNI